MRDVRKGRVYKVEMMVECGRYYSDNDVTCSNASEVSRTLGTGSDGTADRHNQSRSSKVE